MSLVAEEALIAALTQLVDDITAGADNAKQYKFVAASQSNSPLATSLGAIGDEIRSVVIVPSSTTPGNVSIKDGAGSSMVIFAGTGSTPVVLTIRARSANGGWSITTGASVTAFVTGQFS